MLSLNFNFHMKSEKLINPKDFTILPAMGLRKTMSQTRYNKATKQVWRKSRFGSVAYVMEKGDKEVPLNLDPITVKKEE